MATKSKPAPRLYVPVDARDPATVRAIILARKSGSGAEGDVKSQVEQCQTFIEKTMGWHLVRDPYTFAELGKSGYRNVERPILDEVLKLAQRREVDVIVAREFERVARTKARRYMAIGIAERFGVEFRFANLLPTGKLPDTQEGRLYLAIADEFGEMERDRIVERTTPGRIARWAKGLPGNGCSGPPYGYKWDETKKTPKGKNAAYERDDEEYPSLLWMFETVDHTDVADVSVRSIARELDGRGVRTPAGRGRWSVRTVSRILRNPIYAGLGRNLRWHTDWKTVDNPETGRVYDQPHVIDRLRDAVAWKSETETFAHDKDAIPPIIDPDLWQRVQEKLTEAAAELKNRGGPRRTDLLARSTLLDGGLVRCVVCKGVMTRYWHSHTNRPYYECDKRTTTPSHPHGAHRILAPAVDALVLKLVAEAVTDPGKLIQLADAAEREYHAAHTDAEIAAAALDTYRERLEAIAVERTRRQKMLALCNEPDDAEMIKGLRTRIAHLDREEDDIHASATQSVPRHERANERQFLLDRLRHANLNLYYEDGAGQPVYVREMPTPNALKWLGLPSPDELGGTMLPLGIVQALGMPLPLTGKRMDVLDWDRFDDEYSEWLRWGRVPMVYVAEFMLKHVMPRDEVRRLLRALGVVAWVSPPRSRAEWRVHGMTPIHQRVGLELLGSVQVRSDAANLCILGHQ